jgi:hypothetical protein
MLDLHGIRRITDDRGVDWEVWEAHPRLLDRRRARERRARQRADSLDRRSATSHGEPPLADAAGWLVFKSAREERRRTPIPTGWESMAREQLLEVLRGSRTTGPYPRVRQ